MIQATTSIFLNGYQLSDPVTVLTDLFITFYTLYVYLYLRKGKTNSLVVKDWSAFYLYMFISSLLGALNHAGYYLVPASFRLVFWLGMQITACIAIFFAVLATAKIINQPEKEKKIGAVAAIIMLVFIMLSLILKSFLILKINIATSLVFIIIEHYKSFKKQIIGSGLILYGMLISIIPVFVHSFKWNFGIWFNHNDISHVIMFISLIIIFGGVRLIEQEAKSNALLYNKSN